MISDYNAIPMLLKISAAAEDVHITYFGGTATNQEGFIFIPIWALVHLCRYYLYTS